MGILRKELDYLIILGWSANDTTGMEHVVLYHPARSQDPQEFRVCGLGIREEMMSGFVDRPAGTGSYLFALFLRPIILKTAEGVSLHKANTFVIWGPHDHHYYGSLDAVWDHSWLHCGGRMVEEGLGAVGIACNQAMPLPDPEVFEWHLQAIHREMTAMVAPDRAILANIFRNLLLEVSRAVNGNVRGSGVPESYVEVCGFLERQYGRRVTLAELARRVHYSVPHFCRLFRRHFGTTPLDYHHRLRMHHASLLLRDRNLRIGEIAVRLGYEDACYFSRVFKKFFRVSPREMRLAFFQTN